jgi:DNA polymerase III subunit epsilon
MLHEPLIVLDFETTGLRAEDGDRITEVGLVRIEDGAITQRYQSLVNCDTRVPDYITVYTGITQRMVDGAPPVTQVLREVADFIGETPVVAHNAAFDQRFFVRECRRQRIGVVIEPFICSLRLARRVYPEFPSHALGALTRELQLRSCGAAHRAAADAEVTAELMLRMGRDIASMHSGVNLTARALRRLMHLPVKQVPAQLERLCA